MSINTRKRTDPSDAIQERCIRAMQQLGLNPRQVWLAAGGEASPVSYDHVQQFLTRRSGMGSHKLQHVLPALRLDGWLRE